MSPDPLPSVAPWRQRLAAWIEGPRMQTALIALIVANAGILGAETSRAAMEAWGPALIALDHAILAVFVVEIALRIAAHGWRFFRDPWSVFDFVVVAIALVPASEAFSVLRALRVLRVLRLVSMVPSMRRVVAGLLAAIPGLSSVFAIMCIIFYVSAVVATKLFAASFPELFGDLGASFFTLFQVMTLEGWSGDVARPVMEKYPYAWVFFVLFILVSTFTMLNLFIGVIVNAIQSEQHADMKRTEAVVVARVDEDAAALKREIEALRGELRELKSVIGRVR
jgi:voltage-gated sodium channel